MAISFYTKCSFSSFWSTIPYLQRFLNKDLKRKAEFNDLQTFKHVVKKRKTQLIDKDRLPMQVNYVGYANPIT